MKGLIDVEISEDRMKAYVTFREIQTETDNDISAFFAAEEGTAKKEEENKKDTENEITLEAVIETLRKNRVTYGIKNSNIRTAIGEELYGTRYLVAQGTKSFNGKDARIEYKLNIESSMKPKLDEKGNVDYLNVDNYISVKQGDVLAVYFPPVKSISGFNVFGKTIRGAEGRNVKIPLGKNTEVLADGRTLISKIDGLLQIIGGKISVLPVLIINSDVDTMTGNIDFVGSVKIHGNVCSGMKVKAKGSVEVNGTVESAVVMSEGDVIINGGIKGMGKGAVSSGGNFVSSYIENAVVRSMGNITTNSIIQSQVESEGRVNVTGTNGSIIGGTVKSARGITCKVLGSRSYIRTTVSVGVSSQQLEGIGEIEMQIQNLKSELAKINAVLDSGLKAVTAVQTKALSSIVQRKPQLESQLMDLESEYLKRQDLLKANTKASVTVVDFAHPDAVVCMGKERLILDSQYRATTFYIKEGEIAIKKCEVLDEEE